MWGIRSMRRANRDVVYRSLALPPGFRRIFAGQTVDISSKNMSSDSTALLDPVQINDPAASDFGTIPFMVGYDDI